MEGHKREGKKKSWLNHYEYEWCDETLYIYFLINYVSVSYFYFFSYHIVFKMLYKF